jgi:hypothetical protein
MPWTQTYRKLDEAIRALVSLDARLAERLDIAIPLIAELRVEDFPLQCREVFGALADKIALYRKGERSPAFQAQLSLDVYQLQQKFVIEAWPSYL